MDMCANHRTCGSATSIRNIKLAPSALSEGPTARITWKLIINLQRTRPRLAWHPWEECKSTENWERPRYKKSMQSFAARRPPSLAQTVRLNGRDQARRVVLWSFSGVLT